MVAPHYPDSLEAVKLEARLLRPSIVDTLWRCSIQTH